MKNNDIERILFTESELKERAEQIGKQITADFCGEEVILVGVLKGAMVFLSDVMRNIGLYCRLDFITVLSNSFDSFCIRDESSLLFLNRSE